jgi:hypothetical protein
LLDQAVTERLEPDVDADADEDAEVVCRSLWGDWCCWAGEVLLDWKSLPSVVRSWLMALDMLLLSLWW